MSEDLRRKCDAEGITFLAFTAIGIALVIWLAFSEYPLYQRAETARAQVKEWADKLNTQKTPSGLYLRWDKETLPLNDPWGNALKVVYNHGAFAESLEVRSAGKDGQYNTGDDIVGHRTTVNLKGAREAIQEDMPKVAEKKARGTVKGIIKGIKEGMNEGKGGEDEQAK